MDKPHRHIFRFYHFSKHLVIHFQYSPHKLELKLIFKKLILKMKLVINSYNYIRPAGVPSPTILYPLSNSNFISLNKNSFVFFLGKILKTKPRAKTRIGSSEGCHPGLQH